MQGLNFFLIGLLYQKVAGYRQNRRIAASNSTCAVNDLKVVLELHTSTNPDEIKWKIRENSNQSFYLSGGPYDEDKTYSLQKHEVCMPLGMYQFKIVGSTDWYKMSLGDSVIFHSGRVDDPHEPIEFGICTENRHCNQAENNCLIGTCSQKNICHFEDLPCIDCGKIDFEIRFETGLLVPESLSWNLIDLEMSQIVMEKSNSINFESLQEYNQSKCLNDKAYKFNLFNLSSFGNADEYLELVWDSQIVRIINDFSQIEEAYETILCTSDTDCNEFYSNSACNIETRTCYESNYTASNYSSYSFIVDTTHPPNSIGSLTTLGIRVIAEDSETSVSLSELSDHLYGTSNKVLTMKSQFAACSHNKLNIIPFHGLTKSGESISNGVSSISLDMKVIDETVGDVVVEIMRNTEIKFGNLTEQFDLLMLCLPPGTRLGTTQTWKAYAYINGFLSVYNDKNCIYPSVQMHEIGHNLGLSHSNDEKNYGDESGLMGISYSRTDFPHKCFNAPKSWSLGWYANKHHVIDLASLDLNKRISYKLVGFVWANSFPNSPGYYSILKLINGGNGFDYYVSFNNAVATNAETREGADKILITKRQEGYDYADSTLDARLGHEEKFSVLNIQSGIDLVIESYIYLHGIPYIILKMSSFRICVKNSQCDDHNMCTTDSCSGSSTSTYGYTLCHYEPKPCNQCGSAVTVDLTTNEYPNQAMWSIENVMTERTVKYSGYLSESNKLHTDNGCLGYGRYKFSVTYWKESVSSEEDNPVLFKIQVGNKVIDEGEISTTTLVESMFTLCSSNLDCVDFDGCSIDYCDLELNVCVNEERPENECVECYWVSIDILTDNYPDETAWDLRIFGGNDVIISGDPYPLHLHQSGRRKAPTKAGRRKAPTRSSTKVGARHFKNIRTTSYRTLLSEKFFDKLCLEKERMYQFSITDTFGDGICCVEGNGLYTISISNTIVKSGGDFGDSDSLTFKFVDCISNEDCDDGDSCTVDECRLDISTCFYLLKPCHECGAMVDIDINTDGQPEDTTWKIERKGKEIVIGGPYSTSFAHYKTSQCLPFGTYKFFMIDSMGGFSACANHICGYSISAENKVIYEGGDFVDIDEVTFSFCLSDTDCDDNDDCTVDSCDVSNKFCIFQPLPCSTCSSDPCNTEQTCFNPQSCISCGKAEIEIGLVTNGSPHTLLWSVLDSDEGEIWSGGPYMKSDHFYKQVQCLYPGSYYFSIRDIYAGGSGHYSLSVNGEKVLEGNEYPQRIDFQEFEVFV